MINAVNLPFPVVILKEDTLHHLNSWGKHCIFNISLASAAL